MVVLQRVGKCVSVGGEIEYTGLTKTRSEKPRQVLGAEQLLAKAPTSCLCAGSREDRWKMHVDIQSPVPNCPSTKPGGLL